MLNAFLPLYGREILGLTATELGWLFGPPDSHDTRCTSHYRLCVGSSGTPVGDCDRPHGVRRRSAVGFDRDELGHDSDGNPHLRRGRRDDHRRHERVYHRRDPARPLRGAAHGVFGTIYDVGDALGPIAAGLLVAAVGYARMFQVMAAVALVMAVAFAVTSKPVAAGVSQRA